MSGAEKPEGCRKGDTLLVTNTAQRLAGAIADELKKATGDQPRDGLGDD
jgi:hypothetical protein